MIESDIFVYRITHTVKSCIIKYVFHLSRLPLFQFLKCHEYALHIQTTVITLNSIRPYQILYPTLNFWMFPSFTGFVTSHTLTHVSSVIVTIFFMSTVRTSVILQGWFNKYCLFPLWISIITKILVGRKVNIFPIWRHMIVHGIIIL